MQYVAYYRVSTQKQGNSGLGLEAQQQAVTLHLQNRGGEVIESFTEIQSGKADNRPALHKALRKCRLTGATLLIAKLDRLSRNRRFLFELMDSSLKFECADMPEANSLTVGLLACLADYEGQLISERTKAALQAARARGTVLGNPSLAQVRNNDTSKARGKKEADSKARNKEVLAIITELKNEAGGKLSLRQIAAMLNKSGYKTARGFEWKAASVQRVIR